MPQSLMIGLLVLGGVLLLVAITGGKFKIFGAEVDSAVSSRAIRSLSGLLGVVFILIALSQNKSSTPADSQAPANTTGPSSAAPAAGSSAPSSQASSGTTEQPANSSPEQSPAGNRDAGADAPKPVVSNPQTGGYGIVFDPPSNIRTQPSTTSDILCSVTTKTSVHILDLETDPTKGSWYKTDFCEGQIGYINHTQVKF